MTINSPFVNAEGKIDVNYVFLSLDNPENEQALGIIGLLIGADIRVVEGCYKGKEERSMFIFGPDFQALIAAGAQRMWQKQESILVVGPPLEGNQDRRHAHLMFPKGDIEYIGVFQEVTEEVARSHDGWTRMVGVNGEPVYFTCIREDVH